VWAYARVGSTPTFGTKQIAFKVGQRFPVTAIHPESMSSAEITSYKPTRLIPRWKPDSFRLSRPTTQNVVFRSPQGPLSHFFPNTLLFDLTAAAFSYYFALGLERYSLACKGEDSLE
jgi:hypothetical protein